MSVTIYTSSSCAYCPMVKKYLRHFGVNFIEKSTDEPENASEAMRISGAITVPITLVKNGDHQGVVVGLNYRRLSELLQIAV